MELTFDVSPHEGEMLVRATYSKCDIIADYFYINRDAEILTALCDDESVKLCACTVIHPMFEEYKYAVSKVAIPPFSSTFEISYRLTLSGQTGSCPYVRERITPQFTFIRWETFCYPMFFSDRDSFKKKNAQPCDARVIVPSEYEIVSSEKLVNVQNMSPAKRQYTYSCSNEYDDIINCAIAPYTKQQFAFGTIYFLETIGDSAKQTVEAFMRDAHTYMNEHFGNRDISSNITYAAIPDGFGSFACTNVGVIFVQESTFNRPENLNQIVHEFIHLGWNAKRKDSVQPARFFDEAFTSYFETRVMRSLLNDASITGHRYGRHGIDAIKKGRYELVPICKYAEMKYGDLSYSIGAMCLEELCKLLGEPLFDAVTRQFLSDYSNTPADFDFFCAAYIAHSGKENEERLNAFFNDWIYTSNAVSKLLD